MNQLSRLSLRLRAAYRAEPVIINAGVSFALLVVAKFGIQLDDTLVTSLLVFLFGANVAVNRQVVVAPDTAEERVEAAVTATAKTFTVLGFDQVDIPLPDSAGHEPVRPPEQERS